MGGVLSSWMIGGPGSRHCPPSFRLEPSPLTLFHRNNLNKILMTVQSPQDEWTVDACCYCPGSGGTPPELASTDDRLPVSVAEGSGSGGTTSVPASTADGMVAAVGGSRGTTTIPDTVSGGSGTLFLDIVKTPQRDYPNSDLFCYYGYKFEAVCTAAVGGEGGGGDGGGGGVHSGDVQQGAAADVVDSSSEFALLLRLKLGAHNILMAAEVDCVGAEGEAAAAAGKGPKEGSAAAAAATAAAEKGLKAGDAAATMAEEEGSREGSAAAAAPVNPQAALLEPRLFMELKTVK